MKSWLKNVPRGAASEGTASRADSHSAPEGSGPQRTAAAQMGTGDRGSTRALTHADWHECLRKHHVWHQARDSRLCAAVKAVWKMEIKEIKQRFFMACQLFHSKGRFNCRGRLG